MTISEIQKQLLAGECSSEELVRDSLAEIERQNETLNAFLSVSETALEEARAIDERRATDNVGPLAGIPIAVKDNIAVQGWHTTSGSRILEGHTSVYDATVIERLRKAGAILIGRTNQDEFGMGSSTEGSHYGPTKNPWDTSRVPGGSSGGSAAAVASGMVSCALGSDTGGSVRQPSAMCGITGLKPTYGRVSRYGLLALGSSLDQIGVMARTVEDTAKIVSVIEGADPRDATSADVDKTFIAELNGSGIDGLRIGIPKEYFIDGMDPVIKQSVLEAVALLESRGAQVQEISLPHTQYALAAYYIIMPAEASSNLARYDGIRYGYSSQAQTLIGTYEQTRAEGFGAEAKRRIMLGSYVLSAGYRDQYYRKALKVRRLIKQDFDNAFGKVDVIAAPTSPSVAWKLGEKFNDPLTMYLSDIYTISVNLATIPALSVPCGFRDGLPIGLQLMAKPFNEAALYRTGMFYQSITDWHTKTL